MKTRYAALGAVLAIAIAGTTAVPTPLAAQSKTAKPAAAQKIDDEYTRLIKQNLQDPRITTELVDHLPASDTVPSPLKFLGRAVGAPGELTYAPSTGRSAPPRKGATSSCSRSAARIRSRTSISIATCSAS